MWRLGASRWLDFLFISGLELVDSGRLIIGIESTVGLGRSVTDSLEWTEGLLGIADALAQFC